MNHIQVPLPSSRRAASGQATTAKVLIVIDGQVFRPCSSLERTIMAGYQRCAGQDSSGGKHGGKR